LSQMFHYHIHTNGFRADKFRRSFQHSHAELVGALYHALKTVFPQLYLFPARSSKNIVLLATRATIKPDVSALRARAILLIQTQRIKMPGFLQRLDSFQAQAPPNATRSPVLTDDYAPVEGLSGTGGPANP